MEDISLFNFSKEYYTPEEVCEVVNNHFKLENGITPVSLQYWNKKRLLRLIMSRGKVTKVYKTEIPKIMGITFMRKILGVDFDKMESTISYLSNPLNYSEFIKYSLMYNKKL